MLALLPRSPLPTPEHWDEDATPFRPVLHLHAETYKVELLFDLPPATPAYLDAHYLVSPGGNFSYQNRALPAGTPLRIYGQREGRVYWTDDVVIPTLIDMNRVCSTGERFPNMFSEQFRVQYGAVWMSLTPMEMMTQRSGVQAASGKVVIGGLGLGWLLGKVCARDSVEQVIVIEKSQELLNWYGYDLCKNHPKVSKVICDDIYSHLGNHGPETLYLLDIWPTFTGARSDRRLTKARRKLGERLWAWGTS